MIHRRELLHATLTASALTLVAGTVQQLALHTECGVVHEAQALMGHRASPEQWGRQRQRRLNQTSIDVAGKHIKLAPGMNITAEIETSQRRVIEYLLSPIQRAGSESLRGR